MAEIESKIAQLVQGMTVKMSSDEIKYLLDETVTDRVTISNPVYDHAVETDWIYDVKANFPLDE